MNPNPNSYHHVYLDSDSTDLIEVLAKMLCYLVHSCNFSRWLHKGGLMGYYTCNLYITPVTSRGFNHHRHLN